MLSQLVKVDVRNIKVDLDHCDPYLFRCPLIACGELVHGQYVAPDHKCVNQMMSQCPQCRRVNETGFCKECDLIADKCYECYKVFKPLITHLTSHFSDTICPLCHLETIDSDAMMKHLTDHAELEKRMLLNDRHPFHTDHYDVYKVIFGGEPEGRRMIRKYWLQAQREMLG